MATARSSFTKRQRENAKRERQQMKAARRAERKTARDDGPPESDIEIQNNEEVPGGE